MNRLANASSRSTRLYDLRAQPADDRCDVDPRKKPRGGEVSSYEAPPTLPAEDRGEGAIERTVDGHRRKHGADHADRQGQRTALDQLASDPRFLRCRGWVDVAKDLDEIAFGAIWPVHEREHSDEQREKRDERKEDLVRDGAGEEGTL